MESKVIVKCPNCRKEFRIPANKHVRVSCPGCNMRLEFNLKDVAKKEQDISATTPTNSAPKKHYDGVYVGLILIGIGIFFFILLNSLENTSYEVDVPIWFSFLYKIGGKWLVGGIFTIWGGILAWRNRNGSVGERW